jgi:DNA-binding GntR family transcriptional regulator
MTADAPGSSGPRIARPDRVTAGDQAEAALFDAIMDGTIAPGSALRLHDLAGQLGMSIMPVREALRRLEALGLVEIVAHKGAWVRPLTLDDLYDTYFTRMHLERLAIRTAARWFTDADAHLARQTLSEHVAARDAGDRVGARDAHERFHFAMYAASRSQWLMRSIGPAWRNSERYRIESMRHPEQVSARSDEHELMLDALIAHDADTAAALLTNHLRSALEFVAAELREQATEDPGVPTPLAGLLDEA